MKKEEKIQKIRAAAKNKVAETKAYYASLDADAMERRAKLLEDLTNASDNERRNCIARYQAVFADNKASMLKKIASIYAEAEEECQACQDDPQTEDACKEKPQQEHPQQQTVYCDGREYTARIAARRIINKLPHIPCGGCIMVTLSGGTGSLSNLYWMSVSVQDGNGGIVNRLFDENSHDADFESKFIADVCRLFGYDYHYIVAEPISRSLDAFFEGNPLDDFPSVEGKEGGNE